VHCPSCHTIDTKVVDSRLADEGEAIRRRRACPECGYRFTTYERAEEIPLIVVKSDGRRQPFDRLKVVAGIKAAAKGRPVSGEQIEGIAEHVEDVARVEGNEVATTRVGLLVLEALRGIDDVAYLRFASVYKNFDDAADFDRELRLLQKLGSVADTSVASGD
jgi:transcriptional repressor NrdR